MQIIRDFRHSLAALALALIGLVLAAVLACGNGGPAVTRTPGPPSAPLPSETGAASTPAPIGPMVRVGETVFPVELAITEEERRQGLSGTRSLGQGTGMLFVLEEAGRPSFWMKDMHYPLDMLWIGPDCHLVDISPDVPSPMPGTPDAELARASPDQETLYVLEINGGESARLGLAPGDSVAFTGSIVGEYGC